MIQEMIDNDRILALKAKNQTMKNLITHEETIFIAGGYGMVGDVYKTLINFGYSQEINGGRY